MAFRGVLEERCAFAGSPLVLVEDLEDRGVLQRCYGCDVSVVDTYNVYAIGFDMTACMAPLTAGMC